MKKTEPQSTTPDNDAPTVVAATKPAVVASKPAVAALKSAVAVTNPAVAATKPACQTPSWCDACDDESLRQRCDNAQELALLVLRRPSAAVARVPPWQQRARRHRWPRRRHWPRHPHWLRRRLRPCRCCRQPRCRRWRQRLLFFR